MSYAGNEAQPSHSCCLIKALANLACPLSDSRDTVSILTSIEGADAHVQLGF